MDFRCYFGCGYKQKTAYEMRISDWSSDVCSSDLDEMDPGHLEKCLETAEATGADYVYPWYRIGRGGHDPLGKFCGKPWDNNQPHETTITTLVRTELAQSVGFKTTWDLTSPNEIGRAHV